MRFESIARTHVGCRRKINEDSMLSRPDLGLWAVADGMGGHEAGEVASAFLVEKLASCKPNSVLRSRAASLSAALQEANRELLAMAATSDKERTIGSTIVLIVADTHSFTCLWAGDSRAYLARGGVLKQLTHDHSLVQQLVDSGDLEPSAAALHPNANIITRAVGAAPELVIDDLEGEVRPGDVFLLASDGLTRLLSESELLKGLEATNLESMADQLIDTCLARHAPDNVTFIILKTHKN